jgi:hypothetical protein
MSDCTCVPTAPPETITSKINQITAIANDLIQACGYVHRRILGGEPDKTQDNSPSDYISKDLDFIINRLYLAKDYISAVCNTID